MADVMPGADVVDRVKTLTAADKRPALTDGDVSASIAQYPLPDRYGLTREDDDWEPRWDVNAAAAELWGIKAGRVASDFNFKADQEQYDKGDVLTHCLAMEAHYAARVAGGASTAPYDDDRLRGVVVNG